MINEIVSKNCDILLPGTLANSQIIKVVITGNQHIVLLQARKSDSIFLAEMKPDYWWLPTDSLGDIR